MKDIYTVELCTTPLPWPLSFAVHAWFVTTYQDVVTRYEVVAPMFATPDSVLMINMLPPYRGFRRSFLDDIQSPKSVSVVAVETVWQGQRESVAHQLYRVIHDSPHQYPYTQSYRFWPGPNSNTYVAWILSQVSGCEYTLPRNAFGARFTLP